MSHRLSFAKWLSPVLPSNTASSLQRWSTSPLLNYYSVDHTFTSPVSTPAKPGNFPKRPEITGSAANLVNIPHTIETLSHIASDVIHLLRAANETLGVAESLTAGGVMAAITSAPGASAAFRGGVVSYATELKRELLGVDAALIEREGVIHGEVAAQMAQGARRATTFDGAAPTTWGIGTTGVAGPDLQDGKPAGTVFIAIASPEGSRVFGPFKFPGSREQVREATVMEALARLRGELVAWSKGKQGESR